MKNILKITIFKDDDYEIVSGNIYSTKESWGEQYWIAVYNMPSMSFVLCSLTLPLEPIRHISEVMDGDYDLLGHVSENPIDFTGQSRLSLNNIELYLSKK
jgi:hypothetical protein